MCVNLSAGATFALPGLLIEKGSDVIPCLLMLLVAFGP